VFGSDSYRPTNTSQHCRLQVMRNSAPLDGKHAFWILSLLSWSYIVLDVRGLTPPSLLGASKSTTSCPPYTTIQNIAWSSTISSPRGQRQFHLNASKKNGNIPAGEGASRFSRWLPRNRRHPVATYSVKATPRAESFLESSIQSSPLQLNVTIESNTTMKVSSSVKDGVIELKIAPIAPETNGALQAEVKTSTEVGNITIFNYDLEDTNTTSLDVSEEEVQEKKENLKEAVQEIQTEFKKASDDLTVKSARDASDKLIEKAPQIAETFVFTKVSKEFW
jgi:hypothetical protein